MNAAQLHAYLAQQLPAHPADFWPIWLIALTVAWLGLCALLLLHALLRRRYPAPPRTAHKSASISILSICACGMG